MAVTTTMQRGTALLLAVALALAAVLPLGFAGPIQAASETIVISEFRTRGPALAADEFIELHNRSTVGVDVGGLAVRGSNAAGSVSTRATIPAGTIIGPGCFYLLANTSYSEAVAADQSYTTGVADDGGIGVVTPAAAVVDQVGMSAGSFYKEGTTLAPQTQNVEQSYERLPGGSAGHEDTDNNAADFAARTTSAPQNSSSPCLGAGGPSNPSGAGSADPASVEVGGQTLLTVTVTPGANPASTGLAVSADLTPIGGANPQALFDDGTNGDATAGDNVSSYLATVGPVTPGDKVITATITDAEARNAATQITLTVRGAPTEIWQIQGTSHLSPYAGQQVFGVEGVVTAVARNGNSFWMTDPTPDADLATSDGLLVFGAHAAVGDFVAVDGTVTEFRPGGAGSTNLTTTEIVQPTVTVIDQQQELPTTVIGVDRLPPTLVISDDATTSVEAADAVYDPASDGIDFWESLEGMRLQVADAVAVGPRNRFGEIAVISQLQADAGVRTARGGILVRDIGEDGDYRSGDFNPERLILDDALAPTPMVNVNDEFLTDPVGVLDYGFGNFKLLVTETPGRVDNGLAREVTTPQGAQDLAVATYNVENLTVGNSQAKFDALANQIINHLKSPDLIGIEEMQDDSGSANDGVVTAQAGWQRLIDTIVANGGPLYQYRSIDPLNNQDGGQPGGNIRVGFLFRTDRGLEFVDRPGGHAENDTDVVPTPSGTGAQLTFSPGRVLDAVLGGDVAFEDTRKSLAGEFRWRGETLFVVVNHLSSKGDDRPLFGRFQPPHRLTEFESGEPEDGWRHAQAQAINDFVDEILAVDDDAHIIVLGDINDFDFSETVGVLTGERVALPGGPDADGSGPTEGTGVTTPVLVTLFDRLPENERYSYVFDGNSQVLDQILVSQSLMARAPAYDVVHVNAEFADQVSDHDPSVMRVAFQPRRGR